MAVTIYNRPYEYAPVYNPMIYTLTSTNYTQPNFRYIADVYVNGSASYTRLSSVANPTNSSGVFDVSGIIQNFLSQDALDNTDTFNTCPNSIAYYEVKFGEQYGVSSGITNYPNLTTSTGYCFNGIFDPLEFLDFTKDKYVTQNSNTIFLTDCPVLYTRIGEKLNIGFMTDASNESYEIIIRSYDKNNTLQELVRILNPYVNLTVTERRSINVDVSIDNFTSAKMKDEIVEGDVPFIFSDTYYYTVQIRKNVEFQPAVTELKRIYVDELCSKYTPIRFKFMNKYGKYDYYTFSGATTKNSNITRNNYKSNPYQYSTAGYTYNKRSRGLTQYETIISDSITINSDWITEDESIWLEQLFTSPDVYIYEGSNLVSVNITNASYETKYENSQQLFNVVISFTYSQNRKRQRR